MRSVLVNHVVASRISKSVFFTATQHSDISIKKQNGQVGSIELVDKASTSATSTVVGGSVHDAEENIMPEPESSLQNIQISECSDCSSSDRTGSDRPKKKPVKFELGLSYGCLIKSFSVMARPRNKDSILYGDL
ncbi:hypothetical protein HW555_003768 [Spodoptera exigua]|uniref:Uncharacterized protein n=1 Tax=Spodoptera exigua TaxID=7107 RepID=A0A835L8Y0_SPOEX|nr:hypothetical protein HW555_003768 [Spodoptera exigua]